ncbi:cytochrome c-type biogenesis protein CcmH [Ectothiorhodospiraceae bacterium BW-2]|nr:cytochrome c-type biogenesis protein CcmH [Ectothiorhodospiraceae bacterium BW-2]
MRWIVLLLSGLLLCSPLRAKVDIYHFDQPEQEALYKELIAELRCLVCQNQNLADSNAELAQDLRRKTYEMVVAGSRREAIIDYMVERYGDFVLYNPPMGGKTLMLWIGPFMILLLALFVVGRLIQQQRRRVSLSDEEAPDPVALQRAEALLRDGSKEGGL